MSNSMIKKEELDKLGPEEKVKRLKHILESKKREFAQIEELIKKSEKEAKTDRIAVDVAPEPRTISINSLFETSGGQLEREVEKSKPDTSEAELRAGYSAAQQYTDYYSLKKILPYAASGSLTEEQLQAIDKIGERLEKSKYRQAVKEVEDIVTASKSTLSKIRRYAGLD